jgi:hypothetical protein
MVVVVSEVLVVVSDVVVVVSEVLVVAPQSQSRATEPPTEARNVISASVALIRQSELTSQVSNVHESAPTEVRRMNSASEAVGRPLPLNG